MKNKELNRVVIILERELDQKRKDLKRKYGMRLEALDKWIYNEGLRVVKSRGNLFDEFGEIFNPKNK